jgi:hypothetical protein
LDQVDRTSEAASGDFLLVSGYGMFCVVQKMKGDGEILL